MTDPIIVETYPEQEAYWESLAASMLPTPTTPTLLAAGTRVSHVWCNLTLLQPWMHPVWTGRVLTPSNAPGEDRMSERQYCQQYGYVPVLWEYGNVYHSKPADLLLIDRVPTEAEYTLLELTYATDRPIRADVSRGPDGSWTEHQVYVVWSGETTHGTQFFDVDLFKGCWFSHWLIYAGQLECNPHASYFRLTDDGRAAIDRYETAQAAHKGDA